MEIPVEYNLAGQPWEKKEDDQLIKEYNINMLNLLDICKIHKRMPGGIVSRLKRLNLIEDKYKIRGYEEYLQSDLYKEKQEIRKEKRLERKKENNNICLISQDDSILETNIIDTTTYTDRQKVRIQRKQIPSDIIELKKDVKQIKENIAKILEMMNALYEFENNKEE